MLKYNLTHISKSSDFTSYKVSLTELLSHMLHSVIVTTPVLSQFCDKCEKSSEEKNFTPKSSLEYELDKIPPTYPVMYYVCETHRNSFL